MTREPDRGPPATLFGLFRTPGTRNYLIIGFAALLAYFLLMTGRGSETGALIALLIAVPGMLARWSVSPVAVLMLTTYLIIDPNFMGLIDLLQGSRLSRSAIGHPVRGGPAMILEDLLLAAALLAYLMAQYRLMSLVARSIPEDPEPRRRGEGVPRPVTRPADLVTEAELRTLLYVGLGCVVFGMAAWALLGLIEGGLSVSRSLVLERVWARLLVFVWVFGVALMVARAVLGYLVARRMTPEEAAMVIQDTFWNETRREQERVHRWEKWYRRWKASD